MKYIPETRYIFRCASDLGTHIIRKPRIPGARVCLFAGSAVNNIVNKNYDQRHTKNGSKLYFKILKTWKNWESTRISSIPFPFLRTSFPKSHFPSLKIDQSQFPFYPFRTLLSNILLTVFKVLVLILPIYNSLSLSIYIYIKKATTVKYACDST